MSCDGHVTCPLPLQDSEVALEELPRVHKWFVSNHSSRTLCNVCGEALHGVAWNGLSCEGEMVEHSFHCVWSACVHCADQHWGRTLIAKQPLGVGVLLAKYFDSVSSDIIAYTFLVRVTDFLSSCISAC